MTNVVIPVCEICGKQGAVEVDGTETLQRFLGISTNSRNGFLYGALIGGTWCVHCDDCEEESDRLKDVQEKEREAFLRGNG